MSNSATFHEPWDLSDDQRARYRAISNASREAKKRALGGKGPAPVHAINTPTLDPLTLMPLRAPNGLRTLSLFSGGGGLDIAFERAGFAHVASYEILQPAADTLVKARPDWMVFGGEDGDVTRVDWSQYKGSVDLVQGGPPCQPFSAAGRQRGEGDARDMFPEFVRAVTTIEPRAFVAENVPALLQRKFNDYVESRVIQPLSRNYDVRILVLQAPAFGVPQVRKRVFFVGMRRDGSIEDFHPPEPTHSLPNDSVVGLPRCMGARQALGLPDIGHDGLAPTIRSTLTGPRHTTSIVSSASAARKWADLELWPNGVAPSREQARAFVAKDQHFRLSVADCAVLQGFPQDWPLQGPTYMQLGQLGNAVPPPLGYAVACSVADALAK
ncbi:DNA cytosine methyltransferase [Nitriliruptor alkaliphilus]|uniref:DNA cytosine methyltransferase n=1 Tax=Nitriliruptor alkaliphilus TaxID=427918 RepID=UPI0006960A0C|nr:DNA (cytosine-5-)-methyltransferase [Nitriliruptor alkaliphilus]